MEWIFLIVAGFLEVIWAISLKYSQGFSILLPSIVTIIGMIASFYLLSLAIKTLPIGTAYAIWTGIGVVGTVILGIFIFRDQMSILRFVFILMILMGTIGLKVTM